MRYQSVSAVTQDATLRRYVIILWANSLSLRILLRHNTQHYVVKWLYCERMRYHSVSAVTHDSTLRRYGIALWANALWLRICCNTRLNITSLSDCVMSQCAIIAYLLLHRTRHYVVTGMYRERMRYDCVSAVTQDWTLRRNGIVSWENAISVRTCCNGRSHECISGTLGCLIGCGQGGHHVSGGNRCLFLTGCSRVGLLKTHRHKNKVNTMSECAIIAHSAATQYSLLRR